MDDTTLGGSPSKVAALELWGGHECTVNRVGDRYFDQTLRTGHEHRIEDLATFAALGVKALRYPVLWERIAPDHPDQRDWRWTDARLTEIRRLGVRPIAGLCHHGSGPRYTHLLDEGFAPGLAAHARAVAERYPWIDAYTPVNEPLTTARFSALYGHWYPHARDEGAFLTALLNEIEATVLAMKAVREINPNAKLVQTEDLGHVFATEPLAYQAAFENERRWITFDLLMGRVGPDHMMWRFFEGHGLADRVRALADDPCPPDVIGLNYYLSSERLLDHRVDRYPPHRRGGNGRDVYADVEAVRAVSPGPLGHERLLQLAWERFGLPLALTEVHNGCTREEQLRWVEEAWRAAQNLRGRGVPVQAITVWSLLGAVDWNSLLTLDAGHYEPGVFDIRSGRPRPTALVDFCRKLAAGELDRHPAAEGPGWWSRDIRYEYEPVRCLGEAPPRRAWSPPPAPARPLLIVGATGTLGQAMARAAEHRGLAFVLTDRAQLSLENADQVAEVLSACRPWGVVNAAGYVRVDEAEQDSAACLAANGAGVEVLARACARAGAPLLTFSSDLVFDGAKAEPYLEDDAPNPLNVYGRSKLAAERAVLQHGGLAVRTSAFFSPHDPHNFAQAVREALSRGQLFRAAEDQVVSPTYVPDLVDAALDLLIDGETGVHHLANDGRLSWAAFARRIAEALELDPALVLPAPGRSLGQIAARPAFSALGSRYGQRLPTLDRAIARYAEVVRPTLNIAPVKPPAARRRAALEEPRSFAAAAEF